ncbi:MAG: recombinase RecA [Myxococcales bacterium]|nr:recombinase RecA [Myxococcales bacterium]
MTDIPTPDRTPRRRLTSGIPGLDAVLGGGFFHRSIFIINGRPGAGKTILGSQICFHVAREGERALFITLLAETHGHLLANLESLSFYDAEAVSRSLNFINGYSVLEKDGLTGLLGLLRATIREHRASVLVLDGLVTAEQISGSDLAFKKFIHELQTLVGVVGCTVFLLSSGKSDDVVRPEHTMVDGILDLQDEVEEMRAARTLVVRKLRGTPFLRGRHYFEISGDGVTVYPRLESRLALPSRPFPAGSLDDTSLGVPGFDHMLGGGVSAGTTTLVLGTPGSGKTLLGLHFLAEGARLGQNGLYFGFYEHPQALLAKAEQVGIPLRRLVGDRQIELLWQAPVEHVLDALADRLLTAVQRIDARRLVIDGLIGFKLSSASPGRLTRFFAALANELRALGVTTLATDDQRDTPFGELDLPLAHVSALWENMVVLRANASAVEAPEVTRSFAIVKRRNGAHGVSIPFTIDAGGIRLGRREETPGRSG